MLARFAVNVELYTFAVGQLITASAPPPPPDTAPVIVDGRDAMHATKLQRLSFRSAPVTYAPPPKPAMQAWKRTLVTKTSAEALTKRPPP